MRDASYTHPKDYSRSVIRVIRVIIRMNINIHERDIRAAWARKEVRNQSQIRTQLLHRRF